MFPRTFVMPKPWALQRVTVKTTRFIQRQPLIAKAVPTAFGFAFGDFLTQYFNRPEFGFQYDYARTFQMAAIGAIIAGPIGLEFLKWANVNIMAQNPYSAAALSVKFTLDQVIGCVIWQAALMSIYPPYRTTVSQFLQSCCGRASAC